MPRTTLSTSTHGLAKAFDLKMMHENGVIESYSHGYNKPE